MKNNKKILLAVVLGALASNHAGAVTYSYTTIDVPNSSQTIPTSINASGQIAGQFHDDTYTVTGADRGFTYINGAFKIFDIPMLPDGSQLFLNNVVINDSGKVAGNSSYNILPNFYDQGFLLNSGATTATSFAVPNASKTRVTSINNNNQVAGTYFVGIDSIGSNHGYVYSGTKFTYIDMPADVAGTDVVNSTFVTGFNDNGTVVGSYQYGSTGFGFKGFIYNNGNYNMFPDIPGTGFTAFPSAINALGDVAGRYNGPNFTVDIPDLHGFIYSGGGFESFAPPFGTINMLILGINASKQVIGSYAGGSVDSRTNQSFVYSGGNFTNIDVPNAIRTDVRGINDNGQIVGIYYDAFSMPHGFLATPSDLPPPPTTPTKVSDCKKGGWKTFNFKSEKKCIKFVNKGK